MNPFTRAQNTQQQVQDFFGDSSEQKSVMAALEFVVRTGRYKELIASNENLAKQLLQVLIECDSSLDNVYKLIKNATENGG